MYFNVRVDGARHLRVWLGRGRVIYPITQFCFTNVTSNHFPLDLLFGQTGRVNQASTSGALRPHKDARVQRWGAMVPLHLGRTDFMKQSVVPCSHDTTTHAIMVAQYYETREPRNHSAMIPYDHGTIGPKQLVPSLKLNRSCLPRRATWSPLFLKRSE